MVAFRRAMISLGVVMAASVHGVDFGVANLFSHRGHGAQRHLVAIGQPDARVVEGIDVLAIRLGVTHVDDDFGPPALHPLHFQTEIRGAQLPA